MNDLDPKYSTRNQNGQINYYNSIDEAMNDFLSYEGYRLSILLDNGLFVHIYRDELPLSPKGEPGSLSFENPLNQKIYDGRVMVQGETK